MQLNPEQQQVVDSDTHCRVVACPGSGKTRVITTKIGAILKRHPGARVCAVTFTRDAAAEIKKRTVAEIGEEKFKRFCRAGTFHSLAIRQLRNAGKLGKVAKPAEQVAFLRRAMALAGPDLSYEDATKIVETAKTSFGDCPEAETPLYLAYAEILKRNQVEDLFDVMRNAVTLMQRKELPPYPDQFMLVDEFQDTDHIQMRWVLEHAFSGTAVTVVGDDDQSIYGWRGALGYPGMTEFVEKTKATEITLAVNYRCRAEILAAAEQLITFNSARVPKRLFASRGKGGSLSSLRFASREEEADAIVTRVLQQATPIPAEKSTVFKWTVPSESWAVLCRNRRLLDTTERALRCAGIRVRRSPGESIWSRPPYVFMLSLMVSIQTGERDGIDHSLNYALARRVGAQAAHNVLAKIHCQYPESMHRLLDGGAIDTSEFVQEEATVVRDFCAKALAWRMQASCGRYEMVVRGIANWFAGFESGPDEKAFVAHMGDDLARSTSGSLAQRANSITNDLAGSSDNAKDGVFLYTMHGSKGLEFNNVWIIGTESTTIPSPKTEDFEEERRLMYVAMTRAKDNLIVSSVLPDTPSPFVLDAGLDPRLIAAA